MKKSYIYIVIVAVIVIAGGIGLYAALRGNKNNSNGMSNMNMLHTSNSSQSVTTDAVTMQNFAFSPANITVKVGTTVTWTNEDSTVHTVTETDGQDGPKSGDVGQGSSYSFTFKKAGTYHYHCQIHPYMTGTVTVS